MDPEVVVRAGVDHGAGREEQPGRHGRVRPAEEGRVMQRREAVRALRSGEGSIAGDQLPDPVRPGEGGGLEDVERREDSGDPLGDRTVAAVQSVHRRADAIAVADGGEPGVVRQKAIDGGLIAGVDGGEQVGGRSGHRSPPESWRSARPAPRPNT